MSRLVAIAAVSAIAVLLNSACAPVEDRIVLFEDCMKDKKDSTEICQCIVDAKMRLYDKDVIRVFVLRAQGRNGEADRLVQSMPPQGEQTMKVAYATTACRAGG